MPEGARAVMLLLKLDIISEALLHAPFKGTMLFGGELAKLQEANTKRAATFTVFPQPTAPLHLTRMSDEVGVSMTGRALRNLAGEAGDRAGPRLPPRVPNLASLKKARGRLSNFVDGGNV